MRRWVAFGLLMAAGCKPLGPPTSAPTESGETGPIDTDTDTDPVVVIDETYLTLPPPESVDNGRFATSDNCGECHSNHPTAQAMRDVEGNGVAPYDGWSASMMANSARDPLWRAVVSVEVAETPGAAELIGERCMACHAPMGATDASLTGEAPPRYPSGLTDGSERSHLALDGASCTLCHQIEPENLGTPESWKGNYVIAGNQVAYGPHSNPNLSYMPATGWTPQQSSHSTSAELCATCHTLVTEALEPDGTPNGGMLVEQAPYLEMKNSSSAASTCQSCHFPNRGPNNASILTTLARDPSGSDYSDLQTRTLGRHELIGGNTLIPQLFRDYPEILNPRASPADFDIKIQRAREQLGTNTAILSVENGLTTGGTLQFETRVDLLAGHKFPTGIPLRRAWVKVRVFDANSQLIFKAGDHDTLGRILGSDNSPLLSEFAGGPLVEHTDTVTSADAIQIYETILSDQAGDPTFRLLRAAGYLKDNRILPRGWSNLNPNIDMIAPQGVDGDTDYDNEGDVLNWSIPTGGAPGPYLIEAQLLYQTLGNRWAEEIFAVETPETIALQQMLSTADRRPEVVGLVVTNIP